jgi:hypothetical protein
MHYVDLVAILAVVQLIHFAILVGRARVQYAVKAPAVTGHEMFERAYRVQMNTIELIVAFLPALYIAARYWPEAVVAGIGAVYVIGRFVYWRSYMTAPSTRSTGFGLSVLPVLALLLAGLAGFVRDAIG